MIEDSTRSYNHPFTKSDDDANKRAGVPIHEHLLLLISTVDNSGSKDNKIRTDETNNNSPTKRLGEVDCTKGRIFKLQAYSAIKHNHQYQRF